MSSIGPRLTEKVLQTIQLYRMFQAGDLVLVAVSGGPDSIALLHLLHRLSIGLELKLHVFHLDHKMRAEDSKKDALFVKKTAEKLGLPVTVRSFDVPSFLKENKLSPQEGARQVRFKIMGEVAAEVGADKIALGHQADDQVETLLIRLIKGTGPEGLRGIPPVRDKIVRPMIEISRPEIEAYLKERNIISRLDKSNLKKRYLRNKIRLELLPVLDGYNPNFRENLLNLACLIRDEQSFLEAELNEWFDVEGEQTEQVRLSLMLFIGAPKALIRVLLRKQLARVKGNLKDIEFKHIEPVVDFLEGKTPSFQMDLPGGILIFKEYDDLVIANKSVFQGLRKPQIWLNVPGETMLPEWGIKICSSYVDTVEENDRGQDVALLDAETIRQPLSVRSRLPGDRFQPLGLKGTKKLQDFLVDEKIPEKRRDRIPIVEAGGKIVWVVGQRIDERYKLRAKTKKILCLEQKGLPSEDH